MAFAKIRTSLFKLHAVLGLYLFGILALLFLSGTILIFVWEIDASLNKGFGLNEPAASFDAKIGDIYDNVRALEPKLDPVFIERTKSLGLGDKTFALDPQRNWVIAWSHPETAEILSVTKKDRLRQVLFDFHSSFMVGGRIGSLITNSFSILLLGFVLTGLITYRRFWRGFFRMPSRQQGSRAWWGGVHRLTALWVFPFLLVMAITGSYFFVTTMGLLPAGFPKPLRVSERSQKIPSGFEGADLDRALALAHEAIPGLQVDVVNPPFSRKRGIVVIGHSDELLRVSASNKVFIDPVTFDILGVNRSQDRTPLHQLTQLNLSFHTGIWGGFYSRLA